MKGRKIKNDDQIAIVLLNWKVFFGIMIPLILF